MESTTNIEDNFDQFGSTCLFMLCKYLQLSGLNGGPIFKIYVVQYRVKLRAGLLYELQPNGKFKTHL